METFFKDPRIFLPFSLKSASTEEVERSTKIRPSPFSPRLKSIFWIWGSLVLSEGGWVSPNWLSWSDKVINNWDPWGSILKGVMRVISKTSRVFWSESTVVRFLRAPMLSFWFCFSLRSWLVIPAKSRIQLGGDSVEKLFGAATGSEKVRVTAVPLGSMGRTSRSFKTGRAWAIPFKPKEK